MASDKYNDVLMRLVLTTGSPLYAECQTEVTTDEDDFVSDYYNGEFFEVTEFTFGMNLDDKDPATETVNTATGAPLALGTGNSVKPQERKLSFAEEITAKHNARANAAKPGVPTSKFGRWKAASPAQLAAMPPYPLKMEEFCVTRFYDKASPTLFEKCCNSDSIASASLVKRKLIGADMLRGFLRIDFDDLLLTHIEWENGDVVKETFKFVFRKITVTYRTVSYAKGSNLPQLKTMPTVSWNYDMELKKKPS
jgi:type VI protein secretion system component Hcp